jgi:Mce-associated membrane protein
MRMSAGWRVVLTLCVVLAVGALGAAGWFGSQWYGTKQDSSTGAVEARDGALRAARQLAVTLQTIDSSRPEDGLDNWEHAATGELLDQLRRDRQRYIDQLKKSPSTSTANVLETALTELDASAGTATAITALDLIQTTGSAQPNTRQLRVRLSLRQTPEGWKVASTGLLQA